MLGRFDYISEGDKKHAAFDASVIAKQLLFRRSA
jgi:hypothetical protein